VFESDDMPHVEEYQDVQLKFHPYLPRSGVGGQPQSAPDILSVIED
jgi:hypothetical protein